MHLNLCKPMYKPDMITPYSTYLTKHKLLQRSPVTREINISKACHLLNKQPQRKKCRVYTRRDPTTRVGVGFMPLRISSASYTHSEQWFECLALVVVIKNRQVWVMTITSTFINLYIMRPIIYKIWIHYKSQKGPKVIQMIGGHSNQTWFLLRETWSAMR